MEIDMVAPRVADVKRRATMLDRATLLEKGIHILDPDRFMWIQTKKKYDKHVDRLENWKNINEEEKWVNKARLIILFFMKWEAPILMLEFLNTFVIKNTYICFSYKNKMYVINN